MQLAPEWWSSVLSFVEFEEGRIAKLDGVVYGAARQNWINLVSTLVRKRDARLIKAKPRSSEEAARRDWGNFETWNSQNIPPCPCLA
jgi:hypothetical protein